MARSSMGLLIGLVRDLIGDAAGAEQVFTDNQVERALDVHRWDHRGQMLLPQVTLTRGSTEYLDWYSDDPYWENAAILMDVAYASLTPSVSDPINGRWSFTSHQAAVLISGNSYDPYGAAADLLEMWAAKVSIEFDVDADGASMRRSQKRQALQDVARQYRAMQRVMVTKQVRNDLN
jgi:hypothetical protein